MRPPRLRGRRFLRSRIAQVENPCSCPSSAVIYPRRTAQAAAKNAIGLTCFNFRFLTRPLEGLLEKVAMPAEPPLREERQCVSASCTYVCTRPRIWAGRWLRPACGSFFPVPRYVTEPAASTYVRTRRRWAGELLKELKSAGVRTAGITPLCGVASALRGIGACENVSSGDISPAFSRVPQVSRGGAPLREAVIGHTVPFCPMTGCSPPKVVTLGVSRGPSCSKVLTSPWRGVSLAMRGIASVLIERGFLER